MQEDGEDEPQDGEIRTSTWHLWRRVLVQTARDLWTSSVLEWAASLAFYALLSLFPLLIAGMVAASYLVDVAWATDQTISLLGQFLPEGEAEIEEIVTAAIAERGRVGLLSFFLVLLTGRRILGGLVKGLNHVSDVAEQDDTIRRKAGIELALLAGLIVLAGLALASRRLVELLWNATQAIPGPDGLFVDGVSGIVRIVLLLTIFTMVYAFVPRGDRVWRAVLPGAGLATVLYLLAQFVFSLLADTIWTNLSLVYGPLALAALLLTWCWYVALITLIGAGFASHVKVMLIEKRSTAQASEQHTAT
ncbi:MAG: YihY/virulence factor BrkB family protein [Chloroflexota bacterium]|nr:YihY/virulence factor BrkB family protein [Chloroflexota bacterium]